MPRRASVPGQGAAFVTAQTSLYIPGFDPQPIIATPAGTDDQGHTTWLLSPGPVTDAADSGFSGTVTLVEGQNFASVGFVNEGVTLDIACTLSGDQATCSQPSQPDAGVESDTVSFITVQLAAAATPAPSGSQPAATSKGSTSASVTKSGPSPTTSTNFAHLTTPGMVGALGSVVMVFFAVTL
ncbi:hypothetical protein BDN72DRAFT_855297 [Pluteus cervinus]|uniref:Uncharacterized protein n=1 Tax=Pluteus cervinus TaxID=181527 RepID=A0ACD3B547_9AGAR|nr:hypothetical protein BDN72DRAFT_855297 [Pluteus cervinus]